MENQQCSIVEDLFGVYQEGLTNETTTHMVEEHLKQCKDCEKKYKVYLQNIEEKEEQEREKGEKFKNKLFRYRYQFLGVILGSVLAIVLIVGSLVGTNLLFQKATTVESSTDKIEDYGIFEEYTGISKLSLFPEKKDMNLETTKIEKYVYDCYGIKIYPTYQIYLECSYAKEDYEKEKERLLSIKNMETEKSVEKAEGKFAYNGVYAMLNHESSCEYALFLEEEQKIIYVYLQSMIDRRELKFSEKYLPLEYGQAGEGLEGKEDYSIYLYEDFEW